LLSRFATEIYCLQRALLSEYSKNSFFEVAKNISSFFVINLTQTKLIMFQKIKSHKFALILVAAVTLFISNVPSYGSGGSNGVASSGGTSSCGASSNGQGAQPASGGTSSGGASSSGQGGQPASGGASSGGASSGGASSCGASSGGQGAPLPNVKPSSSSN
jgi:hypothetical protein